MFVERGGVGIVRVPQASLLRTRCRSVAEVFVERGGVGLAGIPQATTDWCYPPEGPVYDLERTLPPWRVSEAPGWHDTLHHTHLYIEYLPRSPEHYPSSTAYSRSRGAFQGLKILNHQNRYRGGVPRLATSVCELRKTFLQHQIKLVNKVLTPGARQ